MKVFDKISKDISNIPVEAKRAIITFICLVAIIALLYGRESADWEPEIKERPKIRMRELMSACMDVMYRGGQEVVRIRQQADIGERVAGKTREGVKEPVTDADMLSHRIMYHGLKKAFPSLRVVSEERDNNADIDEPMPNLSDPEFNVVGEEIYEDRVVVWIDPLDATQEYTEGLTEYVTVMAGIAVDGVPVAGIIHKPFSNETLWSFTDRKNHNLTMLMIYDEVRMEEGEDHLKFLVSRSHAGDVQKQVEKYIKPVPKVYPAGGAGYKIWEIIKGDYDVYVHSALIKKWDLCAGEALLNTANGRLTDLEGKDIMYDNEFDYKVETGVIATKFHHMDFVKPLKNILNT